MIVLEIATIGEIEFLEFATLSEIRASFTVYKTQPVDRGRPRYQLATFYDIGAGYGMILIAMHLLGYKIKACELDKDYCLEANRIIRKYLGDVCHAGDI